MIKKVWLFALVFVIFLSGCGKSAQSNTFALPEMPETQRALLDTVSEVLLEGFEYAEPRSGFNRYPVQLVDLDGDGEDEGIVFLRSVSDSNKTYIYIFEQSQSVFGLYDIIEGRENEIYTVSYSKMIDGEGFELIVKWGADEEKSHAITAYSLTGDGVEKTLDITAKLFSVSDISGDGKNEFLAVSDRNGVVYADIYSAKNEKMRKISSVALSKHNGKVVRILSGKVSESENGAFIERESDEGVITDVVMFDGEGYVSVLPFGDICSVGALCADVNDDGIIELPIQTEINDDKSSDRTYLWRSVEKSGSIVVRAFTYHSYSENWFLSMPVVWSRTVSVKKTNAGTNRVKISFVTREKAGEDTEVYVEAPLFNIYVVKGNGREAFAAGEGRITIAERDNMSFVAEIISTEYLGETIDEEFLKSAFKKRKSDWASEILFA